MIRFYSRKRTGTISRVFFVRNLEVCRKIRFFFLFLFDLDVHLGYRFREQLYVVHRKQALRKTETIRFTSENNGRVTCSKKTKNKNNVRKRNRTRNPRTTPSQSRCSSDKHVVRRVVPNNPSLRGICNDTRRRRPSGYTKKMTLMVSARKHTAHSQTAAQWRRQKRRPDVHTKRQTTTGLLLILCANRRRTYALSNVSRVRASHGSRDQWCSQNAFETDPMSGGRGPFDVSFGVSVFVFRRCSRSILPFGSYTSPTAFPLPQAVLESRFNDFKRAPWTAARRQTFSGLLRKFSELFSIPFRSNDVGDNVIRLHLRTTSPETFRTHLVCVCVYDGTGRLGTVFVF